MPGPSPSSSSSSLTSNPSVAGGGVGGAAAAAPSGGGAPAPWVASRSTMSRNSIRPALSWSCQEMIALKVSGLSHRPPIIMSRPASMRLAMAISPSRDSSSTLPISRKYIRTGSSVRPRLASSTLPDGSSSASSSAFSGLTTGASPSSVSSPSTTWMPSSEKFAITSSICSEEFWSGGRMAFSSSKVM